jgi:hypothetical protein
MKLQQIIFSTATAACLVGLASIFIANSLAQATPSTDGSDAKLTEKSTRPMPLRLPGNKDLPRNLFRTQASLTKDLIPGSGLEKFEMITYQEYLRKYTTGLSGTTDISPDRMVAVLVVNFPRGIVADNAEYSNARVISAVDALTGQSISYEITGKVLKSFGPSVVFPELSLP